MFTTDPSLIHAEPFHHCTVAPPNVRPMFPHWLYSTFNPNDKTNLAPYRVIHFVIIAFFVFIIARSLLKEQPAPPGPAMKTCAACGESILARATRCRYCTSAA